MSSFAFSSLSLTPHSTKLSFLNFGKLQQNLATWDVSKRIGSWIKRCCRLRQAARGLRNSNPNAGLLKRMPSVSYCAIVSKKPVGICMETFPWSRYPPFLCSRQAWTRGNGGSHPNKSLMSSSRQQTAIKHMQFRRNPLIRNLRWRNDCWKENDLSSHNMLSAFLLGVVNDWSRGKGCKRPTILVTELGNAGRKRLQTLKISRSNDSEAGTQPEYFRHGRLFGWRFQDSGLQVSLVYRGRSIFRVLSLQQCWLA